MTPAFKELILQTGRVSQKVSSYEINLSMCICKTGLHEKEGGENVSDKRNNYVVTIFECLERQSSLS